MLVGPDVVEYVGQGVCFMSLHSLRLCYLCSNCMYVYLQLTTPPPPYRASVIPSAISTVSAMHVLRMYPAPDHSSPPQPRLHLGELADLGIHLLVDRAVRHAGHAFFFGDLVDACWGRSVDTSAFVRVVFCGAMRVGLGR